MNQKEILKYYTKQGKRTKLPKDFAKKFGKTIDEIMQNVRNIYIHRGEIPKLRTNAPYEVGFETLKDAAKEIKKSDFTIAICRDFSMLTCALLRERGIPARCRCGFGNYFKPDWYEDHWIVEYYDKKEKKWIMVDSQKMKNPLKTGEYINGAIAWQLYKNYQFDPEHFGFKTFKDKGRWYIIGNMMRDFFALLKDERKYGKEEDIMKKRHHLTKNENALLDRISNSILKNDLNDLMEIQKKYF